MVRQFITVTYNKIKQCMVTYYWIVIVYSITDALSCLYPKDLFAIMRSIGGKFHSMILNVRL